MAVRELQPEMVAIKQESADDESVISHSDYDGVTNESIPADFLLDTIKQETTCEDDENFNRTQPTSRCSDKISSTMGTEIQLADETDMRRRRSREDNGSSENKTTVGISDSHDERRSAYRPPSQLRTLLVAPPVSVPNIKQTRNQGNGAHSEETTYATLQNVPRENSTGVYQKIATPPSSTNRTSSADAPTRHTIGRPHIATINVLRTRPNSRPSAGAAPVYSTGNRSDGQRFSLAPTPAWTHTAPQVIPSSSSSASPSVTSSSSFSSAAFHMRSSLNTLGIVFDDFGDGNGPAMGSGSSHSSSFGTSGSSEIQQESSPEFHSVPRYCTSNAPVDGGCHIPTASTSTGSGEISPMEDASLIQYYIPLMNERENHNIKERKRRSRVATACNAVRNMIPGLGEKTDKASVFEQAVEYLEFLKSKIGDKYDQDFIESMYHNS